MKNNIPYGHQWIDREDIKEVEKVLKGDWITCGPKVEEFERRVAKYCGVKYAVACSSGTAALQLAYLACSLKKGDEVITSPLTFAATATAAMHCGAEIRLVDIDEGTLNIDVGEIEKKITKKTKVIAPVDFAGHPCDLDEIKKIAKKHNLIVVEDAAHALGSVYRKKKVGSISDLTAFSFHPVKNITTGEGGMVLTNNKMFFERMKTFRHHGMKKKPSGGAWYYEIEKAGYNYRITDFQCALGLSQMKKLAKFIKKRREIVSFYNKAFKGLKGIILPKEKPYVKAAWHLYPIQVRERKRVFDALRKKGILAQVHYVPLHFHPFFKKEFGSQKGKFPKAERYYQGALSLPLYPAMKKEEVKRVAEAVKQTLHGE